METHVCKFPLRPERRQGAVGRDTATPSMPSGIRQSVRSAMAALTKAALVPADVPGAISGPLRCGRAGQGAVGGGVIPYITHYLSHWWHPRPDGTSGK